jgi:hypothetical protein
VGSVQNFSRGGILDMAAGSRSHAIWPSTSNDYLGSANKKKRPFPIQILGVTHSWKAQYDYEVAFIVLNSSVTTPGIVRRFKLSLLLWFKIFP